MYLSQLMRTFTNYLKCVVFLFVFFHFPTVRSIRKQRSINQTYMQLYTDLIIHKYICDRSLSGDPFHIVNPFLNAKGLFKCDSTHILNEISVRQSVCLSLSDLGFNRGKVALPEECTLIQVHTNIICLLSPGGTLKEPNNNSVGVQYRLLLVYTKQGEEGSS